MRISALFASMLIYEKRGRKWNVLRDKSGVNAQLNWHQKGNFLASLSARFSMSFLRASWASQWGGMVWWKC